MRSKKVLEKVWTSLVIIGAFKFCFVLWQHEIVERNLNKEWEDMSLRRNYLYCSNFFHWKSHLSSRRRGKKWSLLMEGDIEKWLRSSSLVFNCLGSNPDSITYEHTRQVAWPLQASVSSSVKRDYYLVLQR